MIRVQRVMESDSLISPNMRSSSLAGPPSCLCAANQMTLQDVWHHCAEHGWSLEVLYPHCHQLFNTMVSTKEVLEDLFGHLSHRDKTDNRNLVQMSPERAWFHAVLNPRWLTDAWPCLQLQEGDLQNRTAINLARGRNVYLPSTAKNSSNAYGHLLEIVDRGF